MAKFLLDSADINEIKKWSPFISGVTTNPILLEKAGTTPMELYGSLAKLILPIGFKLFIQVVNRKSLIPYTSSNIIDVIYKVPLIKSLNYLLTALKIDKLKTCGTMTYDIIQLQTAINLDANYCIILYHKNENKMFGLDASDLKRTLKSEIELIGASFRNKEEVTDAIIEGMDYVTISPQTMEVCFNNSFTINDYNDTYYR